MAEKVNKIIVLLKDLKGYFGKFALVGMSGIVVNQGILALLNLVFGISVGISGAIAIETSILNNFTLNNLWTWKDRNEHTLWQKLIKYHTVTLFSGLVNYTILLILTHIGFHVLIANLIGIGIGMTINFIFNHFWTFSK